MIRRLALALALICAAGAARATCVLPYTLLNGTLADANQVMANFNALLACINGGFGTVTSITANNGLTATPNPIVGIGTIGLAAIADQTALGNVSGGSAVPIALSKTQLTTLINTFTASLSGAVPVGGADATQYLDQTGNWSVPGAGGTGVTSVTFTGDGVVDSSTPSTAVTSTGTVTATIKNQNPNIVLAGPNGGGAAPPSFRALVLADLPADIALLDVANQVVTGGFTVDTNDLGTVSSGTLTVNCGTRDLQKFVNGGAFTLGAPANDSSCALKMTNNGSAGAMTLSGFTVPGGTACPGSTIDTTDTNQFKIYVTRIGGVSDCSVQAYQ
jgi:hypothetical protein